MTSLHFHYQKIISPMAIEKFNLKSTTQIPSLNTGLISINSNKAIHQQNELLNLLILSELTTYQKFSIIRAKQSIASFNLKKRTAIGSKITIKKDHLWNLISLMNWLILPKTKDHKNIRLINKDFFNIGFKESRNFPNINMKSDLLKVKDGLTITFLMNSDHIKKSHFLIQGLQIPSLMF